MPIQAPRYEDVCRTGGVAARILNVGIRWMLVVSFIPRRL